LSATSNQLLGTTNLTNYYTSTQTSNIFVTSNVLSNTSNILLNYNNLNNIPWINSNNNIIANDNIYVFLQNGSITFIYNTICDVLVVGGGGAGGTHGGGGGGGDVIYLTNIIFTAGTYNITVGAGGAPTYTDHLAGGNGSTSSISGNNFTTIFAAGGQGGHGFNQTASATPTAGSLVTNNYSSGGGGGQSKNAGPGTGNSVSGNGGLNGGELNRASGGGGGAVGNGGNASSTKAGNGGNGFVCSIIGSPVGYGGGGGGGTYIATAPVPDGGDGVHGGGRGASEYASSSSIYISNSAGEPNTGGGGGGGGGGNNRYGASGGSGIVIIKLYRNLIISGNVGIKTNNPLYDLDVIGDVNVTRKYKVNGQDVISSQWTTSGTSIFYNGNVGINLNSPQNNLHVSSGLSAVGMSYPLKISAGSYDNNGTSGTFMCLNTENTSWSKCAIGHVRTDTYDRGSIVFLCNNNNDASTVDMTHQVMRITSSGNVGIGNITPSSTLHLHKSAASQDVRINITDGGTGSANTDGFALIKGAGNECYVWNYENKDLIFGTNGTERFKVTGDGSNISFRFAYPPQGSQPAPQYFNRFVSFSTIGGNFGITNPFLTVYDRCYVNNYNTAIKLSTNGYARANHSSSTYILMDSSDGFTNANVGTITMGIRTSDVMTLIDDNSTKLGWVGIGTAIPEQKLHLKNGSLYIDNGRLGINLNNPQNNLHVSSGLSAVGMSYPLKISAGAFNDGGTSGTFMCLNTENASWSKCAIGHVRTNTYDRGSIVFLCNNNNDSTTVNMTHEVMRITSSGNIGIKTNNPLYDLDVNGNINVTQKYKVNGQDVISSQWTTSGNSIFYNGNVAIGNVTPTQIFQVGNAGRLRIANSIADYSLIGTIDTDGSTNTRIIISGRDRGGTNANGNIEYVSTGTAGSHIFYTTDSTTERFRIANNGNLFHKGGYVIPLIISYSFLATGSPTAWEIPTKGSNVVLYINIAGSFGVWIGTGLSPGTYNGGIGVYFNSSSSYYLPYFTPQGSVTGNWKGWLYYVNNAMVHVTEIWY
jgi:hypothetical protein